MLLNEANINLKTLIYILFISCSASVYADESFLPELNSWLVVTKAGPENSDSIILKVSLLSKDKKSRISFPNMIGPIHISAPNNQIFSCEANFSSAAKSAIAYDLKGNEAFTFEHLGFVRNCGITKDKKIYWLHYNAVKNNKPISIFVALMGNGQVLLKESFEKSKYVKFMYKGNHYSVSVPDAELPG